MISDDNRACQTKLYKQVKKIFLNSCKRILKLFLSIGLLDINVLIVILILIQKPILSFLDKF